MKKIINIVIVLIFAFGFISCKQDKYEQLPQEDLSPKISSSISVDKDQKLFQEFIGIEEPSLAKELVKQEKENNLKENNKDVNDISDDLSKELFEQVKKGNFKEVKNLVKQGASLVESFKDEASYYGKFYGVSSIEKAVELNNLDMVNFFLDNGVDIRTGNIRPSLLHFAPSKEMAELLVKRGVDVNAEDNNGTTALAVAVAKDYYDVAKFLIEKGANVNKADEADFTPLCSAKSKKMAELLLDNGADINSIGEGGTPLDSARNEEIRQFLISRGAKSAKDLE